MNPDEEILCVLLKAAADHLESEAKLVPPAFDYNGVIRESIIRCRTEIEECLLRLEQNTITTIESDLGWRLWSIFGTSLDWDHLASDFELRDEVLSLVEKLYRTEHDI
jgi:hypothetical protein